VDACDRWRKPVTICDCRFGQHRYHAHVCHASPVCLDIRELAQEMEDLEAKYGDVHEVLNQWLMGKEQEADWENRERIGFEK